MQEVVVTFQHLLQQLKPGLVARGAKRWHLPSGAMLAVDADGRLQVMEFF
jgi:hypothetical protein